MMITIKQAIEIRKQILAGEWIAEARLEYDFKPESAQCYSLKKDGCDLWVANGLLFLELKFGNSVKGYTYVKLPFICKLIIWGPAMRLKSKAEKDFLNMVRVNAKNAVDGILK